MVTLLGTETETGGQRGFVVKLKAAESWPSG